jgi:hypothetical protein
MLVEIKNYKSTTIPVAGIAKANSIYYVKLTPTSDVLTYITDLQGIPYPLKDLQGSATSVTNTDGTITIVGTDIKVSASLLAIINGALQEDDIYLSKLSAENIPSYTPIAIYNNQAYRFDNLNPLHQFAFVGFSTNGTSTGQLCKIQQIGEVTLQGWNLTPNTQYLAGALGTLQTTNVGAGFTKVVGYATTANTMQIIKDYTTINK